MPTVTKTFNPADIFQGPADIYFDVAGAQSHIPPTQNTDTLTMLPDGTVPDAFNNGFHLGLTEGPCSISIQPKFNEIHADQFAGPIDVAYTSLACEIDFAVKEINLAKVPKYFTGLLTGSYFDLSAGAVNPAADMLQIGSSNATTANFHSVVLMAPIRGQTNKWLYVFAYKAYLKSSFSFQLSRSKESIVKLKMACVADATRQPRDQVLQVYRMR